MTLSHPPTGQNLGFQLGELCQHYISEDGGRVVLGLSGTQFPSQASWQGFGEARTDNNLFALTGIFKQIFNYKSKRRIDNLLNRLREISRLQSNWNGYGADPIPKKVVARACDLLSMLSRYLPYIDIFPTGADSIQLDLTTRDGKEIEIEIGLDGFSLYSVDSTGREVISLETNDPDELLTTFNQHFISEAFII
jgi:hypothetical protein